MKHTLLISALALVLSAGVAAACQAEVKAKRGGSYVHQWMSVNTASCTAGAIKTALQAQGYQNVVVVNIKK